jgi:hypothetical protein
MKLAMKSFDNRSHLPQEDVQKRGTVPPWNSFAKQLMHVPLVPAVEVSVVETGCTPPNICSQAILEAWHHQHQTPHAWLEVPQALVEEGLLMFGPFAKGTW